jgi:surface antigen
MGTLARYANGAQYNPFAKTETTSAKQATSSNSVNFKQFIHNNRHMVIQATLIVAVIAALSAHLATTNAGQDTGKLAAQGSNAKVSAIDELSSTEVAAVVAITTNNMVSAEAVAMAEKVDASEAVAATSGDYLSKPAVALTNDASIQGITTHKVEAGQDLAAIAKQYGVSQDTISWANDIEDNKVAEGDLLKIPPVNGIIHEVKADETAKSIAGMYDADANRLLAFNDAELDGLKPGQKIIIPDGKMQAEAATPTFDTTPQTTNSRVQVAAAQIIQKPTNNNPNNNYGAGYCTWGVANLLPVPGSWGNANAWDSSARAAGFRVDRNPSIGSIAQTDSGWGGHVGVVIGYNKKTNRIIMKDMNGFAGFGRYGTGSAPAGNYNYIHL